MVFILSLLPPEVLYLHLLPLLTAEDIVSLSYCMRLDATKQLYNSVFHDNTHFRHYDIQMFRQRAKAKLYYIGVAMPGYPFECMGPPKYYEGVDAYGDVCRRMHTPFRLDTGDRAITQVSVADKWLHIRNSQGQLSSVVLTTEYGEEYPKLAVKELTARVGKDVKVKSRCYWCYCSRRRDRKPQLIAESQSFTNTPNAPSRFVDMDSGKTFCALDDRGLLWYWSQGYMKTQGIPVLLVDEQDKPIRGEILKVRSAMFGHLCQIKNLGIFDWGVLQEGLLSIESYKNGYPCTQDRFWSSHATLIPGTAQGIKDFVTFRNIIICLKYDGTISVQTNEKDTQMIDVEEINKSAPFVQLCAIYYAGALLTGDGRVLIVHLRTQMKGDVRRYTLEPYNVPGLKGLSIASVARGGNHCLFLTEEGDVYVWGSEASASGCLGLGHLEDALKLDGVSMSCGDSRNLTLDRPTKIKLPSRAYAVFAHHYYSAILI